MKQFITEWWMGQKRNQEKKVIFSASQQAPLSYPIPSQLKFSKINEYYFLPKYLLSLILCFPFTYPTLVYACPPLLSPRLPSDHTVNSISLFISSSLFAYMTQSDMLSSKWWFPCFCGSTILLGLCFTGTSKQIHSYGLTEIYSTDSSTW